MYATMAAGTEPHPIARFVFDHLEQNAGEWRLVEGAEEAIAAELVALRGKTALVEAMIAVASVAEFLTARNGRDAAIALLGVMLDREDDVRALNGVLGAEVVEKRVRETRKQAEKLLGGAALARTLDRSPAPAGAVRWWAAR
jgi:hypothetical protein